MAIATEVHVKTWQPFWCDGEMKNGWQCRKIIAHVRDGEPETVRIVCPRCGKYWKLPRPARDIPRDIRDISHPIQPSR